MTNNGSGIKAAHSIPENAVPVDSNAIKEKDVFEQTREVHRKWMFLSVFLLAIIVCVVFYVIFFEWISCNSLRIWFSCIWEYSCSTSMNLKTCNNINDNWHIGLMLVIPPTTILLTLVQILRHKNSKDNEPPPYSVQQLTDMIRQIVQAIRS